MDRSSYMKEYYQKHKEKIKDLSFKYYHSGKGKNAWKRYIENNKEEYNNYHKEYQRTNKKKRMMKEKKEIILYFT